MKVIKNIKGVIRRLKIRYGIWIYQRKQYQKYKKRYRQELLDYRAKDYQSVLAMMYRSLSILKESIENGNEIWETRSIKLERMERALFLLNRIMEDDYYTIVGVDYNYKTSFVEVEERPEYYRLETTESDEQKLYNKIKRAEAIDLSESEWNEFFTIVKEDLKGWWD